MLEFRYELSYCGRQVLLVTRSPTPEAIDEVPQGGTGLPPPNKLFGPVFPQRLTMALEPINRCEGISYMRCR